MAQDLIITTEGDTLNCKITKIKSGYIYFTFKHKDEIRNTLLPDNQVKSYQLKYYQAAEVPEKTVKSKEIYPRFRGAINGGWSYRTAKVSDNTPSGLEQYMNNLKSGFHYGLDGAYYFSELLGVGIKYNNFNSKNKMDDIQLRFSDGTYVNGELSDNISINFIGSFFSMRFLNSTKQNCFLINWGMGYLGYYDKAVLIDNYSMSGSTFGVTLDIGYDIGLSKNLALGLQLSYTSGTLTQYKLTQGGFSQTVKLKSENYENLSHINLSIGLRFNQ
ncbi:MAG: hypothetical protein QM751_00370 [Paludibacteraceae bacterium]